MNTKSHYWFLILAILSVYLIGMLTITIMDVDAAQYASMSLEMSKTNSYLQVKYEGANYLDKPPLIFWLCSLAFKLLGVSQFVYRLPAFLFTILGAYATFQFSSLFYNKKVGWYSVLILLSTQAYFLIHHDVRTDTILADTVIFSLWQLALFIRTNQFKHCLLGFIGVGLAMLEKGPIGMMIPVLAFSTEFITTKKWNYFFKWQWLVGIVLVLIMLAPMTWGLYQQFGWEGPYFYYWKQSFGRMTGESEWNNHAPFHFLFTNFLWSFLPWTLIALVAITDGIKQFFRKTIPEYITIGGFLFTFIALSVSKYQLPHYIFVVYPLAAIITGRYLDTIIESGKRTIQKRLFYLQMGVGLIVLTGILLINLIVFPEKSWINWLVVICIITLILIIVVSKNEWGYKLMAFVVLIAVLLNYTLNTNFYPSLLKYQAGSEAAKILIEKNVPKDRMKFSLDNSFALSFYSDTTASVIYPHHTDSVLQLDERPLWLYTNESGKETFINLEKSYAYRIAEIIPVPNFSITLLTFEFLNPATREQTLEKKYLLRLEKKKNNAS